MNANDQFFARDAKVDSAAVAPLPASRKIYVQGSRADLRVPMREIAQSDTPATFGAEKNPPLAVYDCSGPYTDPDTSIDIRRGLAPLRAAWIAERDDTVELAGPTSAFGQARLADPALAGLRFDLHRKPRVAQPGCECHADALRAPRHRHAGDGVRRDPREPAAATSASRSSRKASAASIRARTSAPRFPR